MTNLEWLVEMKKQSDSVTREHWKFRIMKALEIIAETLIDTNRLLRTYIVDNDSLAGVITTLENIETALNRR